MDTMNTMPGSNYMDTMNTMPGNSSGYSAHPVHGNIQHPFPAPVYSTPSEVTKVPDKRLEIHHRAGYPDCYVKKSGGGEERLECSTYLFPDWNTDQSVEVFHENGVNDMYCYRSPSNSSMPCPNHFHAFAETLSVPAATSANSYMDTMNTMPGSNYMDTMNTMPGAPDEGPDDMIHDPSKISDDFKTFLSGKGVTDVDGFIVDCGIPKQVEEALAEGKSAEEVATMAAEGGDFVDVIKSHCPQHHEGGGDTTTDSMPGSPAEVPTMDSMNSGNPTKCAVPDWCSMYPPEIAKEKPECQCPESLHPLPTMDSLPGSTTEPEVPTTEPEVPTTEPEVPTTEPEVPTTEPEVPTTEPEVDAQTGSATDAAAAAAAAATTPAPPSAFSTFGR